MSCLGRPKDCQAYLASWLSLLKSNRTYAEKKIIASFLVPVVDRPVSLVQLPSPLKFKEEINTRIPY